MVTSKKGAKGEIFSIHPHAPSKLEVSCYTYPVYKRQCPQIQTETERRCMVLFATVGSLKGQGNHHITVFSTAALSHHAHTAWSLKYISSD